MGKSLVIVESKAKAKTIGKFLGRGYSVKASIGHVRDLPKKKIGIDVENGFAPTYVTIRGKAKVLKELKDAAKTADMVYLASDFDREGEAIAWHIAQYLKLPEDRTRRVVFNEITKSAILTAIKQPGSIDMNKVDAQQARRVMDRLVGYQVSPVLWKTIYYGLSAGRVQSVALRLICERETEIEAFDPVEFWTVDAIFANAAGVEMEARLERIDGKKIEINDGEQARAIIALLEGSDFAVSSLKKRVRRVKPLPPFITSTLQREAANRLRFSSKKTMMLAQQLYEGLPISDDGENIGLITYMRTDSTRMADEAISNARDHISASFGKDYLSDKERRFKAHKKAQDAHEAIRPTSVEFTPDSLHAHLSVDQLRLYKLIWQRFVATQMAEAVYENTTVDIESKGHMFRTTGSVVRFAGWTAAYPLIRKDVRELPQLDEGEELSLLAMTPNQHFTKPPPRYSESSLIKELESNGIGRPSTYAAIIDTLKRRKYVAVEKRQFRPTELGRTVWDLLGKAFPNIFNVEFTAGMEDELDRIEAGEDNWIKVVGNFYHPFRSQLDEVEGRTTDLKQSLIKETDQQCEKCGSVMVEKWGRNGRFLACSAYPKCKFTSPLEGEEPPEFDIKCDQCEAPMVVKHGRFGEFLGCSKYPECKNTMALPTGVSCPQDDCPGLLVQRRTKRGRVFYGCSMYPKCSYAIWDKPVPVTCPSCQTGFMVEKKPKGGDKELLCLECGERMLPGSEGVGDEPS